MPSSFRQLALPVDDMSPASVDVASSTFSNNMSLPVHRWFRYSAGFSGRWAEAVIRAEKDRRPVRVFDPFAGSGTTLLAAQAAGIDSVGIEAHPFVMRIARAKLLWNSDPEAFRSRAESLRRKAKTLKPGQTQYPSLIHACYDDETLSRLDLLRRAFELQNDGTPASELVWLALVSSLRRASRANTAQWQYVLPKKSKKHSVDAFDAFDDTVEMIYSDMRTAPTRSLPDANLIATDARTCEGVADGSVNLVVTSPPYPNNYDYADATRLEMSFMLEIAGWGDLQDSVRRHLIRSCSQHVPEKAVSLDEVLCSPELVPIISELRPVCEELAAIRQSKGGKKTYHLMIACYFKDLALTWRALGRICDAKARVCFVIGDSAPYGVYVPVVPWLGKLAIASGFDGWTFEKTRDRNIKWKNRKHRVPLQEGRLWVER